MFLIFIYMIYLFSIILKKYILYILQLQNLFLIHIFLQPGFILPSCLSKKFLLSEFVVFGRYAAFIWGKHKTTKPPTSLITCVSLVYEKLTSTNGLKIWGQQNDEVCLFTCETLLCCLIFGMVCLWIVVLSVIFFLNSLPCKICS